MRKLAVIVFVICLSLCLTPASTRVLADSGTAGFKDVAANHWALGSIKWAVDHKILSGYPDGTFRPEKSVTEPEFLAMLFRAFPDIAIPPTDAGESWYTPYFSLADTNNWPVWQETDGARFDRGRVAQVLAATQGKLLVTDEAVQYLLDHDLVNGKTSATVAGFGISDKLKRAEAITLIKNLKDRGYALTRGVGNVSDILIEGFQVRGIAIGDSEASVIAKLGKPARKDASEYGFQWYIYNNDYSKYAQIGIKSGKVVGLNTNTALWTSKEGIKLGSTLSLVRTTYGEGLDYILKGNTRFNIQEESKQEAPIYLIDGQYVTFFIDIHENNTVTAIQLIDRDTELSLRDFYGPPSEALRTAYEREAFDLANAVRVRMGMKAFAWDDAVAETARKHSKDMAVNDYFDHQNKQGKSPFDRMEADGISYRAAAENIAAGQTSAIFAHEAWMNSMGHRENLLGDRTTRLGVGVYMGGSMHVYYTQNFYSP
ncbi:CAP-associated domain-containing protein [Cohnella suwonensis]|uniref:CAP-associated domain-containing protein n=1 Tax=Cohnella suwonensis TaxID=696072 RepID=A0ABW0M290_9BACL